MGEYAVIGKRVPRVDGIPKSTGLAEYAADMVKPGMLHGRILRSSHAHAKIHNIDTTRAERLVGVRAVCVGKEFGDFKYGLAPDTRDEVPLARDKVRYFGEEVAAVAAATA